MPQGHKKKGKQNKKKKGKNKKKYNKRKQNLGGNYREKTDKTEGGTSIRSQPAMSPGNRTPLPY